MEKTDVKTEFDPALIEKFGPIENNERPLANEEFLTGEKVEIGLEFFKVSYLDHALAKWDLLSKL